MLNEGNNMTRIFVAPAVMSLRSCEAVKKGSPTASSARLPLTPCAVKVSLDHPLLGIGIGQFKYFFGAYIPDFARSSGEIATYATGIAEFRTSTFNLFVRLMCEFGALGR